jgi:hypothetical protein
LGIPHRTVPLVLKPSHEKLPLVTGKDMYELTLQVNLVKNSENDDTLIERQINKPKKH